MPKVEEQQQKIFLGDTKWSFELYGSDHRLSTSCQASQARAPGHRAKNRKMGFQANYLPARPCHSPYPIARRPKSTPHNSSKQFQFQFWQHVCPCVRVCVGEVHRQRDGAWTAQTGSAHMTNMHRHCLLPHACGLSLSAFSVWCPEWKDACLHWQKKCMLTY